MKIEEKIKKSLNSVKPSLKADGGDVEFVSFDRKTGVVKVRLLGMCTHCPMAEVTLKNGIGAVLKKEVPEVKEVINA